MLFKRCMGITFFLAAWVQAAGPAGVESVWITRPDGAQSCSPGSGTPLEKGASELKRANIPVLNSKKGSDGMMHAQMCGVEQGTTNAFQVPKENLSDAIALGYQELALPTTPAPSRFLAGEWVWIGRSDGAKSCAPKSGVSLAAAKKELKKANISVIQSKKGRDGKMHAQACGMDAGTTNLFQISKMSLADAVALGYQEVPAP